MAAFDLGRKASDWKPMPGLSTSLARVGKPVERDGAARNVETSPSSQPGVAR